MTFAGDRPPLQSMRAAASTAAMTTASTAFTGGRIATRAGSKRGKFLLNLRRAAMRAFGPRPFARTNQDLAVLLALFTMKLVNWHGHRLVPFRESIKPCERSADSLVCESQLETRGQGCPRSAKKAVPKKSNRDNLPPCSNQPIYLTFHRLNTPRFSTAASSRGRL